MVPCRSTQAGPGSAGDGAAGKRSSGTPRQKGTPPSSQKPHANSKPKKTTVVIDSDSEDYVQVRQGDISCVHMAKGI